MGSKTFGGVRFAAWSNDHDPPHVHGYYAEVELVVDLIVQCKGVRVSARKKNPKPRSAKKSDVAFILKSAAKHFDLLLELWERA